MFGHRDVDAPVRLALGLGYERALLALDDAVVGRRVARVALDGVEITRRQRVFPRLHLLGMGGRLDVGARRGLAFRARQLASEALVEPVVRRRVPDVALDLVRLARFELVIPAVYFFAMLRCIGVDACGLHAYGERGERSVFADVLTAVRRGEAVVACNLIGLARGQDVPPVLPLSSIERGGGVVARSGHALGARREPAFYASIQSVERRLKPRVALDLVRLARRQPILPALPLLAVRRCLLVGA